MIPVLLFGEWPVQTLCSSFHIAVAGLSPQLNILRALCNIAISAFAIAGLSSKVLFPPASYACKLLPSTRLNGTASWTESGHSLPSR